MKSKVQVTMSLRNTGTVPITLTLMLMLMLTLTPTQMLTLILALTLMSLRNIGFVGGVCHTGLQLEQLLFQLDQLETATVDVYIMRRT